MSGLPKALCGARAIAATFAVGSIVYLAMILGPLARLEQIAGAKPFDLRPGGYSRDSALAAGVYAEVDVRPFNKALP